MWGLLQRIGAFFQYLLGLVVPFVGQARRSTGLWRVLGIVLHVLIVALVVAGLYYINSYPAIYNLIPSQNLGKIWLPILFLLVYALGWLSWWLWKLLVSEEEDSDFPDIDRAWQQALEALSVVGLDVRDLPLFLILGRPEEDERTLLRAAELNLRIKQAPSGDAPLHLYATQDAIYVTCVGASLLGTLATYLAPRGPGSVPAHRRSAPVEESEGGIDVTLTPGGANTGPGAKDMAGVLRKAEREGRPLTKAEQRELRYYFRKDNPHLSPLRDAELMDHQEARLRHLCRLIDRDRHPYCGINGILLLLPFAGMDSEEDTSQAGQACQRDLMAVHKALKVHCPLTALVCDLETAPGFADFIQRFSADERRQRIGSRCPLVPDFREGPTGGKGPPARMVQTLADWLCQSVVQRFAYGKFELEKQASTEEVESAIAGNSHLFLFCDEVYRRGKRLGRLLTDVIEAKSPSEPILFGGCYFAGTGMDAEKEQAFVKSIFDKLSLAQSSVYWTDQARTDELTYQRWVSVGWTSLTVMILALVAVAVIWFAFFSGSQPPGRP